MIHASDATGLKSEKVCVVVPCFNEASRFDSAAFDAFLKSSSGTGFVLVDDGSNDDTLKVLGALAAKHPERVRVLPLPMNQGKAEAVRQGMLLAMADESVTYAGFWDADLATPLSAIEPFVQTFQRRPGISIVFGARVALLGRKIERRRSRHYFGRVFATAASMVLGLPVYDTQCGAKLVRNDAPGRSLFATPFGSRWIFDVELLARYLKSHEGEPGIYELPLDAWKDIGDSKVRATDFLRAVGEMAAIHRTYRLPGPWRFLLDMMTHPFTQYVGTGAVGTALHFALLIALVQSGRATPTISSTLGALLGAVTNYALTYHLTFVGKRPLASTLPRFLGVGALAIALNAAIMYALTTRASVNYLAAQIAASALVLGSGFLINRRWEFGEKQKQLPS